MNTIWKYAMIKVAEEFDLETNEKIEDVCELVELHQDSLGEWIRFYRPTLTSPSCLNIATVEVMKDGVNTWFWENGKFSWSMEEKFWRWNAYEDYF